MQKLKFINGNGIETDLTDNIDFGIVDWSGFSDAELDLQSQTVPEQDGSVYLDGRLQNRVLSVTVALSPSGGLANRYELRRKLIKVLNPKLGEGKLVYKNDYLEKQINVIPRLPVIENKNADESGTVKAECTFEACNPYWEDLEESEITSSLLNKGVAVNDGDVPSQVEMIVDTSFVKNLRIVNEKNGKMLRFPEALTTRTFIDTNMGRKGVNSFERNYKIINIPDNIINVYFLEEKEEFIAFTKTTSIKSKDGENWYFLSNLEISLTCIVYNKEDKVFVGIGIDEDENTTFIRSIDGENWEYNRDTGTNEIFVCINYGIVNNNSVYWAGTESGEIWNNELGGEVEYWHRYISRDIGIVRSIEYIKDNVFYICHDYGVYNTSINTSISNVQFSYMKHIPELNKIIAFDYYGGIYIGNKNTNITNWEVYHPTVIVPDSPRDMIYIKNTNTLVLLTDNAIFTSKNGYDWDLDVSFSLASVNLNKFTYDVINNIFVFIGDNGEIITGQKLTQEGLKRLNIGTRYEINNIIYSERLGKYFAISENNILSSENGKDWISIKTLVHNTNKKIIIYENENQTILTVVSYGYDGASQHDEGVYRSYDGGATWNEISNKEDYLNSAANGLIDNNIITIVIGDNGKTLYYKEGKHLITRSVSGSDNDICFGNGKFITVGNSSIQYSIDGENWIESYHQENMNLISVDYDENIGCYIAVGNETYTSEYNTIPIIMISEDGIYWRTFSFNTISPRRFTKIRSLKIKNSNSIIMVLCTGGLLLSSRDGVNWLQEKYEGGTGFDCIFLEKNYEHLLIVGTVNVLSYFSKQQNQIDKLSSDSDMTFNLEVGENPIRISYTTGEANIIIRHKNKYIGV